MLTKTKLTVTQQPVLLPFQFVNAIEKVVMLTYTGNYVLRINSLASAVKIRFFSLLWQMICWEKEMTASDQRPEDDHNSINRGWNTNQNHSRTSLFPVYRKCNTTVCILFLDNPHSTFPNSNSCMAILSSLLLFTRNPPFIRRLKYFIVASQQQICQLASSFILWLSSI